MGIEFKKPLEDLTEDDLDAVRKDGDENPRGCNACHVLLFDAFDRQVYAAFYTAGGKSVIVQATGCSGLRFQPTGIVDYGIDVGSLRIENNRGKSEDVLDDVVLFSVSPRDCSFRLRYDRGGTTLSVTVVQRRNRQDGDERGGRGKDNIRRDGNGKSEARE